ncbi:hypothetical protein [Paenibacillus qinlingensis]|uniref:Uncharacterized protein n=1 Tax=Paenibacillus qinlingensis TaxID=1837343 RepID=A0ABU1P6Q4_9BACL|nr:hypothetical protein [Paenibacillus qinlingensis]MDR6555444.1 hypothetical protein [Paenibacillus qinlingensis]
MAHREMTVDEEQFYTHALTNHKSDSAVVAFLKNQAKSGQDLQRQAGHLPVTVCCEVVGLYHNNGVMCCNCGRWSPRAASYKLKDHIKSGLYR